MFEPDVQEPIPHSGLVLFPRLHELLQLLDKKSYMSYNE